MHFFPKQCCASFLNIKMCPYLTEMLVKRQLWDKWKVVSNHLQTKTYALSYIWLLLLILAKSGKYGVHENWMYELICETNVSWQVQRGAGWVNTKPFCAVMSTTFFSFVWNIGKPLSMSCFVISSTNSLDQLN